METMLPMSATQCRFRYDVFSTDPKKKLNALEEETLRAFIDVHVSSLERQFSELETPLLCEVSPTYQDLKEHLKLERQAGRKVFPGRKNEERSESFCRAEKGGV